MKIWDFDDFLTLSTYRDGRIRVVITIDNRANIYKFLKERGFGFFKYKNSYKYFRKTSEEYEFTTLTEIHYYFLREFLEKELIYHSKTVTPKQFHQIFNDIIAKEISLVKNDNLFKYYLFIVPNEKETHKLNMLLDYTYKINFENKILLEFFSNNKFNCVLDEKSKISINQFLYYKNINQNRYLIFHPFANGYDCWIASFGNEKKIGKTEPLKLEQIQLNFKLERDINKILNYLN